MIPQHATLPAPPAVELDRLNETKLGEGGFLVLRRLELATIRDGVRSEAFRYDCIDRRALDAAVIVAHHTQDGCVYVWLRSCVRPPLALRPSAAGCVLWELPAGLIEPGEVPFAAAARELGEELGFDIEANALVRLGPPAVPAPGFVGELHHFFHVEVDASRRTEPKGDGSPIELDASVVAVPLAEALAACARGAISDEKTELALRRFAEVAAPR